MSVPRLVGTPPSTRSLLLELAQNGPVGVLVLDTDGTVAQENSRFRRIADATADTSWIGRQLATIPGFSSPLHAAIVALLSSGVSFRDVEGVYERPDGTRRLLVATGSPALDARSGASAAFVTFIDTTTWRSGAAVLALEADVAQAEAALRNAALAHSDALTLLERAVEHVGSALGASVSLGFVSGGTDYVRCATWPTGAEASAWELRGSEWPQIRSSVVAPINSGSCEADQLLDALGVSHALLLPVDGAAPGALLLGRDCAWSDADIAAGSRLAALFSTLWAWVESDARFQRTVAELDDAMFTYGYDEYGNREYAFITPQVEALTGLDPDALLAGDVRWTDQIDSDDRPRFEEHEQRLVNGFASRVDVRIRNEQGETIWISERATPSTDAAGRPVAGGLLSDITAQKEAESKLHHARLVAERASQTRMAFLRLMSHELRTPLGAIKGFAELLVEEVQTLPDAPPEVAEFAGTIAESTERALRLVSDLLDLSNLETGEVRFSTQPVNLVHVAKQILERHLTEAASRAIDLSFDSDADITACADHSRVEQILSQLIANALAFTEAGRVVVRVGREADTVWAEVEDTGVGMAEDFLEAIFEPFAQEDTRVNRDGDGTGLGLAIASRLARRMDGKLDVWSAKGVGSRFRLSLPLALG